MPSIHHLLSQAASSGSLPPAVSGILQVWGHGAGELVAEGPGVCLSPRPSFLSINIIAIIPKCYRCRNWGSDRLHGSPSKVSQEHSCFQSGMIRLLIHSFFQSTKGNLLYTIHWSCSGELDGPRPPEEHPERIPNPAGSAWGSGNTPWRK